MRCRWAIVFTVLALVILGCGNRETSVEIQHLGEFLTVWKSPYEPSSTEVKLDDLWTPVRTEDGVSEDLFEAKMTDYLPSADGIPDVTVTCGSGRINLRAFGSLSLLKEGQVAIEPGCGIFRGLSVAFMRNGSATCEVELRRGPVRISISASGDPAAGVLPQMAVYLNDSLLKVFDVTGKENEGVYFVDTTAREGTNLLTLAFTNDFYRAPEDRNLFVKSLQFVQTATLFARRPPRGVEIEYLPPARLAEAYRRKEPSPGLLAGSGPWRYYEIGRDTRPAMPLPPSGEARLGFEIGGESLLRLGVAVLPFPNVSASAPVSIEICMSKGGRRFPIDKVDLSPTEKKADQKWLLRTYSLGELGSGFAELEIRTQANSVGERDEAGLGKPLILISEPVLVTQSDSPKEVRNVILVSLDTLRADHLSCYGYDRITSPHLDEFAAENVFFETAIAPSNWTLPSHVSMLSSLYPSTHGVLSMSQSVRKVEMLGRILKDEGFSTMAVTDGGLMDATFGFSSGFDCYEDHNHVGFRTIMPAAERWLRERGREPFFLFLHTYDTHSPYDPPKRFRDRVGPTEGVSPELLNAPPGLRLPSHDPEQIAKDLKYLTDMYDACISYVDNEMNVLFSLLKELGYWDNTIVIITSDHGEEFMEHGRMGHGNQLYEESIRVPLLVRIPGVENKRVTSVAQVLDIPPTIMGFLGIDSKLFFQGESLLGRWNETGAEDRVAYSEMEEIVARRVIGEKFIFNTKSGSKRLYDLTNDPKESRNLAEGQEDRCKRLAEDVQSYREENEGLRDSEAAGSVEVPEELADQLRDLGYL